MHSGSFWRKDEEKKESDTEKKKAWKQRYGRLLNVEFPWCVEDLSEAGPVLGPGPVIIQVTVEKSLNKMKK